MCGLTVCLFEWNALFHSLFSFALIIDNNHLSVSFFLSFFNVVTVAVAVWCDVPARNCENAKIENAFNNLNTQFKEWNGNQRQRNWIHEKRKNYLKIEWNEV